MQFWIASCQLLLVYAAVGQGGVQGRRATGVFANEAGPSGWSQLIDSVTLHPPPPLAHEPSAGPRPTSQSRPPAMLQSHHAADHHQQAPHMAAHTQPPPPPTISPEQLAQAEAAQLGLQFQYDSFSDSVGDELMPDAPSQPPQRPGGSHMHTAAHEAAQPAQQSRRVETPVETPPPEDQGLNEEHQQQEVEEQQHEQHSGQPAVVPQTDGAGDSDSGHSQDPPVQGTAAQLLSAQQPNRNGGQAYRTGALPEQQASEPALQADPGLGEHTAKAQQAGQPVVSPSAAAAVAVQRPRRRRSRHVVQHAVRLAAAARHAMDSVAAPEHADNARLAQGAPGRQLEPQLPSWLQPHAAADRVQFQSEPQLPQAWIGNVFSDPAAVVTMPPGSSAQEDQGQGQEKRQGQEQGRHLLRKDSQYGGIGRVCNVPSHHVSQSTVAAAPNGSTPDVPSQMVSNSRTPRDLQWQQGQQRQAVPTLQQTQRLASQVVSDSRATSDLRWAQHRQTWQASLEQRGSPSQEPAQQHGIAATQAHELEWEQPASAHATAVASRPTSEAASGAASEAAGGADDLEVVISDSQPSPLQKSSR